MNFEVSKPPNSIITLSSIDYPIFELASCNKPPAKYPLKLMQSYPYYPSPLQTNLNKLPFVFFSKWMWSTNQRFITSFCDYPPTSPLTPPPPLKHTNIPLKNCPPLQFLLSFKLYNCLFFANVNVNSNNLVQKLQALRVNVEKKEIFFQKEWMLLIYCWEKYCCVNWKKKVIMNYLFVI